VSVCAQRTGQSVGPLNANIPEMVKATDINCDLHFLVSPDMIP